MLYHQPNEVFLMRSAYVSGLLVLACSLPAMATTAFSADVVPPTVINACVSNATGITRVVASSNQCINGLETYKT